MRCEPHSDGSQAEQPHDRPQEYTGNTANGDECHRRSDHQSPAIDEGVERRGAVAIGDGGRQTEFT